MIRLLLACSSLALIAAAARGAEIEDLLLRATDALARADYIAAETDGLPSDAYARQLKRAEKWVDRALATEAGSVAPQAWTTKAAVAIYRETSIDPSSDYGSVDGGRSASYHEALDAGMRAIALSRESAGFAFDETGARILNLVVDWTMNEAEVHLDAGLLEDAFSYAWASAQIKEICDRAGVDFYDVCEARLSELVQRALVAADPRRDAEWVHRLAVAHARGIPDAETLWDFCFFLADEVSVESATAALEIARPEHPYHLGMLQLEIDLGLRSGEGAALLNKTRAAVFANPNAWYLRYALGRVYRIQYVDVAKHGPTEEAVWLFDRAMEAFDAALQLSPDNRDLVLLPCRMAWSHLQYLSAKATSTVGQEPATTSRLKTWMRETCEWALPYLQEIEREQWNHPDVARFLRDAYALLQDGERSGEFARRLELIEQGGKLERSYFRELEEGRLASSIGG